MALSINTTSAVQTQSGSAAAIKTANLAQNQQMLEGQMALNLIQSAALNNVSMPTPGATVGSIVNIKV